MPTARVLHGDCRDVLVDLLFEDFQADAVVCDPPYHLASIVKRFGKAGSAPVQFGKDGAFARMSRGFMGKVWDGGNIAADPETWKRVYEVMKPGAHLLAFGGTRTYHRMICAIEDAGFEIRDCIMWMYGQGMPKSHDVSYNIMKWVICLSSEFAPVAVQSSPLTRVVSGEGTIPIAVALAQILPGGDLVLLTEIGEEVALHVPTDTWPSEWAKHIGLSMTWLWRGSLEDVFAEARTCITATGRRATTDQSIWNWLIGLHISQNIIRKSVTLPNGCKWPAFTVGLNSIGGSTSTSDTLIVSALGSATWNPVIKFDGWKSSLKPAWEPICVARKPLAGTIAENVLAHGTGALNIEASRVPVDVQADARDIGRTINRNVRERDDGYGMNRHAADVVESVVRPEGRWPANAIHDGSPEVMEAFGSATRFFYCAKAATSERGGSKHPTVKPLALMHYLCKLVCPPDGTILDPFAGSGSTGEAAILEGFNTVLIENEAEYINDIRKRLDRVKEWM